ncbi:MAG: AtpZ/AtpI family protein [Acidimicrobiia bacterium]
MATHRVDPAPARQPTAGDGRRTEQSVPLEERRQLYSGFGDALSLTIEFVATPLIFAAAGFFLDRWLGTDPYLTIALGAFALIGVVLRAYYVYQTAIEAQEAGKPWTRTKR